MPASCPCCGDHADRGRLSYDRASRQTHWVDADVLAVLNAAHADAERRGAAEVDLIHLMIILCDTAALNDLFESARLDVRVLLAVLIASAGHDQPRRTSPRTARDLRHLLDLSQRTSAIYGSRVMGLTDLLATLLAGPATLDGVTALNRWLWAARAYPQQSRIAAMQTTTIVQTSTSMSSTAATATIVEPSPTAPDMLEPMHAAGATSADAQAATDNKIVRLKSRASADAAEELADDEPSDPGQDPDPELEKLGVKRYYLSLDDDIVRAPSIGPRTAERLHPHGVTHVKHLLACDPERLSARLGARHLTASRIAAWKHQARLVCTIPWLRGMHAQLLVGAGYASIEKILSSDRSQVCAAVTQFAMTRDGQSILRGNTPPELDRIMRWIENSQHADPQRALWGKMAMN
jgi:predicted flap endonuclease-1-like 5' DNA nuclease